MRRRLVRHPSVAQAHGAVGARGQGLVVGDQHQGRAGLGHQVEHQVGDVGGVGGVEVAGGLVGEQQGRTRRPARGPGPPAAARRRKAGADSAGAGRRARPGPASRRAVVVGVARAGDLQRRGDVLLGGHVGQQVEGLEDQRHPARAAAARGRPRPGCARSWPNSSTRAAARLLQPGGHGDQRRLARAGRARPAPHARPPHRADRGRAGSPPVRPPTAGSGRRSPGPAGRRWRRTTSGLGRLSGADDLLNRTGSWPTHVPLRFPAARWSLTALAALPTAALRRAGQGGDLLGDSITAGLGLPGRDALPAQLHLALERLGVANIVRGAGVSGDTTAGGAARVDFSVRPDTVSGGRGAGRQRPAAGPRHPRPPGPTSTASSRG